jgi:predicted DNA-binding ribbon-helix-helix protein
MTNQHRHYRIDIEEIAARNQVARHMIAGFSAEMPLLAEFWRHLDTALTDNLALAAEVTRLTAELAAARLDVANLLAAIRAALAAWADGEADPLYYLRDELSARQVPPGRHGRAS